MKTDKHSLYAPLLDSSKNESRKRYSSTDTESSNEMADHDDLAAQQLRQDDLDYRPQGVKALLTFLQIYRRTLILICCPLVFALLFAFLGGGKVGGFVIGYKNVFVCDVCSTILF